MKVQVWGIAEDLGDGSSAVRLFKSKDDGLNYIWHYNENSSDYILEKHDLCYFDVEIEGEEVISVT